MDHIIFLMWLCFAFSVITLQKAHNSLQRMKLAPQKVLGRQCEHVYKKPYTECESVPPDD